MSCKETPRPKDEKERQRLKTLVKYKWNLGDRLMARDVEKVHKWELVKVEAMFPFWIQDRYYPCYVVSYPNGRTRVSVDEHLRTVCDLLCQSLHAKKSQPRRPKRPPMWQHAMARWKVIDTLPSTELHTNTKFSQSRKLID